VHVHGIARVPYEARKHFGLALNLEEDNVGVAIMGEASTSRKATR